MTSYLVFFGFIAILVSAWIVLQKISAEKCWLPFRGKVPYHILPHGQRLRNMSGKIGDCGFSRSLNFWIDSDYFYIHPSIFFRIFHPIIAIPLADVRLCDSGTVREIRKVIHLHRNGISAEFYVDEQHVIKFHAAN